MSAHTPWPWNFMATQTSLRFCDVQCADGTKQGRLAASIFHPSNPGRPLIRVGALTDDPEEVAANAHLVAAAPDLLDELRKARQVIADAITIGAPDFFSTEKEIATHHAIARIDRVIAKATGAS